MNLSFSRGMTLIEILVVLLIMGLLVSVSVLSTGVLARSGNPDTALAVAEDISRMLQRASQQALANNEVLGWHIESGHDSQLMQWWRWSSFSDTATSNSSRNPARWLPIEDIKMPVLKLPDNISLQLSPEMAADLAPGTPAAIFFPGREYSAFEIYIRATDNERVLARVWPERNGRIRWGAL